MWLIWWVIDKGNWLKTRHIFDVASYQIRQLIENSSCDWYGELSITEIDRKLVIYLMWRVIDEENWSNTRHVIDMVSYWLRKLIENSSYIWCGELSMKKIDRKLVMWLIWWVIDNGNWLKTCHIFDVASYQIRQLIENSSCDWYGELSITEIDRKLVIYLMWQVIKYDNWSKTRHVIDMVSYP
jgi:RNase P/RNase MRP subunit POP5